MRMSVSSRRVAVALVVGTAPELAVQAAIEAAENSAGAGQLNTCVLVGQPVVFGPRRTARG